MIKALTRDVRLHVGFTLFLVWLLGLWHFRQDLKILQIFAYPLLSIALIAALDVGLTYIRFRKVYLPTAAAVSGFLVGLILAPSEPVYVIFLASILASLSKQFLAVGVRRHIFNPAAFGIIGVNLIFGTTVAWWGVSWGKLPLVILVPLMLRILWKLKRLILPISFLITYLLLALLNPALRVGAMENPTYLKSYLVDLIFDGTILLFALVMLPEPITSRITGYFKYGFGILVAVSAVLVERITNLSEIFLPALLLLNLGSFVIIWAKTVIQKQSRMN